MIYNSINDIVGNTPLVRISNIEKKYNCKAELYAKLEYLNPSGSAKDRVAKKLIEAAEKAKILVPGATIIEPTSGNTGIGLAAMGVSKGYRVILTMPDSMSKERIQLIKAYGAEVVLTPAAEGMAGSVKKAEELAKELSPSFIPGQFDNPNNPLAHYETTGHEIFNDMEGKLDFYVATVGTGGTLSGTGKYLKDQDSSIKVVAVEPKASPLLSEGHAGPHNIQGIGGNFIPKTLDRDVYDEIITVTEEDAYEKGKSLAVSQGFLCGISSGAALQAAVEVALRDENVGKKIVVLLPDSGDRYLTTEMFS